MSTLRLIAGISLAALAGVLTIGGARADTFTFWNQSPPGANSDFVQGDVGLVNTFTGTNASNAPDGLTVSGEAFNIAGTGTGGITKAGSASTLLGTKLSTAFMGDYTAGAQYGLGVSSQNEFAANGAVPPYHTVGNDYGVDLIIFKLPSTFTASSVVINGNFGGGMNFALFQGTGSSLALGGTGSASFTNQSLNTLTSSAGFSQITSFTQALSTTNGNNNSTDTISFTGNSADQYLIVAASLSDFGTTTNNPDYFKIQSIGGTVGTVKKVPEPSTLMIFGVGLAGLAVYRRRRRTKA